MCCNIWGNVGKGDSNTTLVKVKYINYHGIMINLHYSNTTLVKVKSLDDNVNFFLLQYSNTTLVKVKF